MANISREGKRSKALPFHKWCWDRALSAGPTARPQLFPITGGRTPGDAPRGTGGADAGVGQAWPRAARAAGPAGKAPAAVTNFSQP